MEVKCPYSEKCSDYSKLCGSCKHNEKRSYYEPTYPVAYSYYPTCRYWCPYCQRWVSGWHYCYSTTTTGTTWIEGTTSWYTETERE